jgi:hypothetical protein
MGCANMLRTVDNPEATVRLGDRCERRSQFQFAAGAFSIPAPVAVFPCSLAKASLISSVQPPKINDLPTSLGGIAAKSHNNELSREGARALRPSSGTVVAGRRDCRHKCAAHGPPRSKQRPPMRANSAHSGANCAAVWNCPVRLKPAGGEGEIRTHGTLARTTVFETVPIDHSGTSPRSVGLYSTRSIKRKRAQRPGVKFHIFRGFEARNGRLRPPCGLAPRHPSWRFGAPRPPGR